MESLPSNRGRESCNNGWYNEIMKEILGTTKQPLAHIDPGPWFLPSSVLRVRMILLKFTVAFENESKLLVESWSCDLSSNLVGSWSSPLSLCLKTLWFYALAPGVWTFGTCQGCGGREQIWSAGEKLQGFGNLNSWAKNTYKSSTATILAVICFPLPAFYVEKKEEVGERDAIGATSKGFIDLRGFWSVKPYRNSFLGNPPNSPSESSTWRNRNHGRWMSGTINRFGWAMRKRGIRPFWSSVVKTERGRNPMETRFPRFTSTGNKHIPSQGTFEDDFPFSQGGICYSPRGYFSEGKWTYKLKAIHAIRSAGEMKNQRRNGWNGMKFLMRSLKMIDQVCTYIGTLCALNGKPPHQTQFTSINLEGFFFSLRPSTASWSACTVQPASLTMMRRLSR